MRRRRWRQPRPRRQQQTADGARACGRSCVGLPLVVFPGLWRSRASLKRPDPDRNGVLSGRVAAVKRSLPRPRPARRARCSRSRPGNKGRDQTGEIAPHASLHNSNTLRAPRRGDLCRGHAHRIIRAGLRPKPAVFSGPVTARRIYTGHGTRAAALLGDRKGGRAHGRPAALGRPAYFRIARIRP